MSVRGYVKRIILFSAFIVASTVFVGAPTHAATPQHIAITPSSASFSIDPGASKDAGVDVINEGDEPFVVTLSSAPYRVEGLNYDPKFTQLPGTVDASKWITFKQEANQVVAAHKLFALDFTVTIPKGTAPGGYYAVIFAQTNSLQTQSTGVVAHNRVGEILYITVNGPVTTAVQAKALAIPRIITTKTTQLQAIFTNTGGVHFLSTIDVSVKDVFGKPVVNYTNGRYILPQTERQMGTTWTPTVPIGIFHIEESATVPTGTLKIASKWVIVIQPWVIIALIAIIGVIVVSLIVNIRKAKGRRSND